MQHTYGGSLRGDDAALGQTKGTKNPLPQKSLLSRLTFTWVSNLMSLGNKRPLQMEDLWQLRPEQRMENMSETFAGYLQSAKSQTGPREEATAASPGNILREFWASPTTRATAHMFRRDFVVCGVLKFLNTLIQFTPSLLISRILKKLSAAPSKGLSASAVDMVTLPLLLLLSLSSKSVIENQYLDNTIQLGLKVKGSISSAIYRKSLQLSPAGKMNYTVGEIVNYLQIDTNRMEYVAGSVHVLWDSIFQVCGYMLLLMQFLGPSSLGGLAVMLVVIPINIHFQKRLSANKAAILKATDSRIGVTNEVLQGVRTIKSYNWEKPFAQQLQTQRELEIRALKKEANTRAILLAILSAAPSFVAMVTLSIYALLGHELTPAKVFTALALFNQLRYPVKILPIVVNKLSDGIVSLRRLDRFLAAEEVEQYVEAAPLHQDTGIEISDGTFTWSNEVGESEHVLTELPRGSLKDIQLQIKRGELVAVIGPVGSGKSTLITSMLGDLHKVCGRVALSGDVAYVPQASWIPNDSLRNVVTFGSEFKQDPYTEALRVCGLEKDLALLDNGDLTEIGERGVNLSGGQKQRLSLARAMYQDADIYLFDDPLSALDAEVGRAVFKDCIKGSLRSKTRVLVTHQLSVLPEVDRVVIMNVTESGVGYILDQGTFPELLQRGHNLKNLVQDVDAPTTDSLLVLSEQMASYNSTTATTYAYTGQVDKLTNISANATATINGSLYVHVDSDEPPLAAVYAGGDEGTRDTVSGDDVPVATYVPSSVAVAGTSDARQGERVDGEGAGGGKLAKKSGPVSLIVAEERADGAIKLGIYQRYYRAGGKPWLLALAAGALLTSNGSVLLQQWIVGAWTGDVGYVKRPLAAYLTGICMCAVLTATFTWLRTYLAFLFGTAASMSIHDAMTSQVLRAPLSYFESTPAGRLVQRFSKDLDCIDNNLPNSLQQFVAVCLNMAGALISMSFATPRFATVIGPLLAVYIATTNYYRNVARELKRIQSISRSPVYSHFGETLGGLNVIRSFRKQALYRRANEVKIDDSMSAYFALKAVDRWLSFRLEALGTAIVFFSALFAMMQTAEAGRAGIALSQALGITSLLNWAVRQGADVESLMNSVERVMYIIDKTPSEKYFMPDDPMHNAIGSGHIYDNSKLADDSVEDANGPAKSGPPSGDAALALAQSGWPWRGAISFSGVSMRYRHDMEPVLRGVTFDVLPGESIGIVGRTVSRGDHTHTHMPTHMPETIKPIYCSPLHPIVMYMH